MIRNLGRLNECYTNGRWWESAWRKVPAIASTPGVWSDLSSSPGTPKPNYYVGAELTATALEAKDGMYHGGNVAPATKHLHKIVVQSASAGHAPAEYKLLDYLLFYPLIDMDSTDEQPMVNTVTLPRYADGAGVEAMLVATNPYLGGAVFSMNYIDVDGVSQTSCVETSNVATLIGTVIHSGAPTVAGGGPFIRRRAGCRGIRSVTSITFLAPNGGLAALVLVKPLTTFMTNEIICAAEYDFATQKPSLPRILDGAYLGMIGTSGASWAAAPVSGTMTVVWA